jgi:hypothetical protein
MEAALKQPSRGESKTDTRQDRRMALFVDNALANTGFLFAISQSRAKSRRIRSRTPQISPGTLLIQKFFPLESNANVA